jgi:hypothetical protein
MLYFAAVLVIIALVAARNRRARRPARKRCFSFCSCWSPAAHGFTDGVTRRGSMQSDGKSPTGPATAETSGTDFSEGAKMLAQSRKKR